MNSVDEGVSQQRLAVLVLPREGDLTVPITLLTADIAPAPANGDVAKLLDINVGQAARAVVLVTTHRFPGRSIDMRQPVQPSRGKDLMDRRRLQAGPGLPTAATRRLWQRSSSKSCFGEL